jgi:hypothetical protein
LEGVSLASCGAIPSDIDDYIDELAELAAEADIVEVFVETPETVQRVQEVVRAPLAIKAPDPETLLGAVRLYNGCPLITDAPRDDALRERLRALGAVVL